MGPRGPKGESGATGSPGNAHKLSNGLRQYW